MSTTYVSEALVTVRHSRSTHLVAPNLLLDGATLTTGSIGLIIIGLAAFRCFWNVELSYNEGWNAYHQTAALRGDLIYPAAGTFVFNNYPPLSFLVIGNLARLGGDVVVIGRLISLGSVVVIALASGVIVSNLSNQSVRSGLVGAAVCLTAFCLIFPHYIGMNDPQLFGQAIMTIALAVYTHAPERPSSLIYTVLLMAIAGLIKHNILAVPVAITIDVMLRSPRRLLLFLIFSAVVLIPCYFWLQDMSAGRIWSNLLNSRTYSLIDAIKLARDFFASAFAIVLIGAIGVVGRMSNPGPRLVASYGFVALLIGGLLGGGAGTATNLYFDVVIASALGVGLLVTELIRRPSSSFVGIPGYVLAAVLILASAVGALFHDTYRLTALLPDPVLLNAFTDDVAYLRAQPGDAICADSLLCFRAGKPFVFDVVNAVQAEKMGVISSSQVTDLMKNDPIPIVELHQVEADVVINGGLSSGWYPTFVKEVEKHYELRHRSLGRAFFELH